MRKAFELLGREIVTKGIFDHPNLSASRRDGQLAIGHPLERCGFELDPRRNLIRANRVVVGLLEVLVFGRLSFLRRHVRYPDCGYGE